MPAPLIVQDVIDAVRIRPTATPTDTYSPAAARGAGSGLAALADGLSALSPKLAQYGALKAQDEQRSAEIAAGEYVAQLSASQEAWSGAIRDGKIAPDQSPWFRFYAAKKMGAAQGDRFSGALGESLAALGDNPSPEAFEEHVAQARSQFLTDSVGGSSDNAHFMEGFQGTADLTIANARRQFMARHSQAVQAEAGDNFGQSVTQIIRTGLQGGRSVDDIAAAVNAESAAWQGVNPAVTRKSRLGRTAVNEGLAQAVRAYAKAEGRPELLKELAAKVKAGDGALVDTPEFTEHLAEDINFAEAIRERRIQREQAHVVAEQKAVIERGTEAAVQAYQQDGPMDRGELLRQFKAAGIEDPTAEVDKIVRRLPELYPKHAVGFMNRISTGRMPSEAELFKAFNDGELSEGQYNKLVSRVDHLQQLQQNAADRAARRTEAGALRGVLTLQSAASNPLSRLASEYVQAIIKQKTPPSDPILDGISGPPRPPVDALQAQSIEAEATAQMVGWLVQNGSSDPKLYQNGAAMARKFALAAAHSASTKLVNAQELIDGSPLAGATTPQAGPTKAAAAQKAAAPATTKAIPADTAQVLRNALAGGKVTREIGAVLRDHGIPPGTREQMLEQVNRLTGSPAATLTRAEADSLRRRMGRMTAAELPLLKRIGWTGQGNLIDLINRADTGR